MTDSELAIIILAAGQGTRMKSATPKVLHQLAGIPIIGHVTATAAALDAARTMAVVRHERDAISAVISEGLPDVVIVDQDEVPGTGRAVELAVDTLPVDFTGDVLVLNGDVPLLDAETLARLVATHRESGSAATVLSSVVPDATGYGRIIRSAGGSVDRIVEHKDATAAELAIDEINAGIYVFGLSALRDQLANVTAANAQGEKYLTDVIGLLRRAGSEVAAVLVDESWKAEGINDRAQLSETSARLNALIVRGWQLAGVTVNDPATTWIDLDVRLSPDVTILPNTQLLGATVVATGATVGPDTTLLDCEIGENAVVRRTDGTLAVIAAGGTVGPFAYLRAGANLGADGKIGTFVEVKNSRIGASSKVPHLSYIGDATIGEHTNLGAGAITANYDGAHKNRTEIGSHVHAGSHNVFVAPVRIGDGVYTGAGAVIRKDVGAGDLALSVAPQRNVDGWTKSHRAGTPEADAVDAAKTDQTGLAEEPGQAAQSE